ncbi:MAG: iron-containing alcohol dehydrogenase [Bacilli bacterium]|nr:iron-containing alcohol dehydrogenase [Bacilli bacterium]
MNPFKVAYYRTYQGILFLFQQIVSIKEPPLISEERATLKVGSYLKDKGYKNVLIVTGPSISRLGLLDNLIQGLYENNIKYTIFSNVKPNPTIENVEEGVKVYKANECDSIIALGGGSPIDCAKTIGARLSNPKKPVEKLKGLLKVTHKIPFLVAIPTTAGSGSEVTVAAVISNSETSDKYALTDPKLIPSLAVHDPNLFMKLPKSVTAATGMDALTHAIEAYIGRGNSKYTSKCGLESIKLIYENLIKAYENPEDLKARKNMLKASYLAGVAITNAYVGYVHALAHSLGGKFDTQHGLANAVLLPNVLEAYGEKAYERCAQIADYVGLSKEGLNNKEKTDVLIYSIRELNAKMSIDSKLHIKVDDKTMDELVDHALKEANPLYPVPKELGKKELRDIYLKSLSED